MSDGSGEQTELTEKSIEDAAETLQERVIRLYNSPKFHENAVGLWLKVLYEAIVVAVGLFVLFLPFLILSHFDVLPVSVLHLLGLWSSLTVWIFGITWCFSEPSTSDSPDDDES